MSADPFPLARYVIGQAEFEAPRPAPGLYLVPTPIGNLRDITLRALEVLAGADIVACEDTRVTRVLLNRYGIARPVTAYHEHNALDAGQKLLAALAEGRSVALASDAGTPLISDPGQRLVLSAAEEGHAIYALPGASALTTALSGAGLASDGHYFGGFLPSKSGARRARFDSLRSVPGTLAFFESPNRVAASLRDAASVFGDDRQAIVARELSKTFETFHRGTLTELAGHFEAHGAKGEIVLLIAQDSTQTESWTDAAVDSLLDDLSASMPTSKAAAEAARATGRPKGDLYRRLLELKG